MDEDAVRARTDAGELYVDQGERLEVLEAERVHGKELLYDYNHARPGQTEGRLLGGYAELHDRRLPSPKSHVFRAVLRGWL
jgi:Maltose acetyltransferase hexapeptide capping motif